MLRDQIIFDLIEDERERQTSGLELIASENFVSDQVMEAQGSVLTNKYAEGYPNKRYYGGCEVVDIVEQIAIDRAKELFGAEYVNVQPHSGSQANTAVYAACLKPGDKILGFDLSHANHDFLLGSFAVIFIVFVLNYRGLSFLIKYRSLLLNAK